MGDFVLVMSIPLGIAGILYATFKVVDKAFASLFGWIYKS